MSFRCVPETGIPFLYIPFDLLQHPPIPASHVPFSRLDRYSTPKHPLRINHEQKYDQKLIYQHPTFPHESVHESTYHLSISRRFLRHEAIRNTSAQRSTVFRRCPAHGGEARRRYHHSHRCGRRCHRCDRYSRRTIHSASRRDHEARRSHCLPCSGQSRSPGQTIFSPRPSACSTACSTACCRAEKRSTSRLFCSGSPTASGIFSRTDPRSRGR